MNKKFDQKLKQKLENLEIAPTNSLWEKIEQELDSKKKKKALIIPFWYSPAFRKTIAASVMFLLGGLSTYMILNTNSLNKLSSNDKELVPESETNLINPYVISENIFDNELKEIQTNEKENLKNNTKTNLVNPFIINKINSVSKLNNTLNSITSNNYYSNIKQENPLENNSNKNNSSNSLNLAVSDYAWVYDNNLNAYNVVLKKEYIQEPNLISSNLDFNIKESTSFMSLENKEEKEEEEIEILEIKDEEDSYKQFKPKVKKLNYKGFWLGPNIGYESVFIAKNHYPGASFGIDIAYDFGGSFGLQSGLKYSLNHKFITLTNNEGSEENYKSEFNGLHIPLILRYKFTKLSKIYSKPLSFNLIAGIDYSYIDTKKLNQIGLVAGAEYDIFTQIDMMLTFGLKGGLYNNLNLNKIDIPENINQYNYNINTYLSLRFLDRPRKKEN